MNELELIQQDVEVDVDCQRIGTILEVLTAQYDDGVPIISEANARKSLENKIVQICGRW